MRKKRPRNYSWAELMKRVYEFAVLKCPDCNGHLKILASIHPPINARKILECMGFPKRLFGDMTYGYLIDASYPAYP
jgi:hypothetical protein